MKEVIILVCVAVVFLYGYFQVRKLTDFLKKNRRGRKNYEYYFIDEDDEEE